MKCLQIASCITNNKQIISVYTLYQLYNKHTITKQGVNALHCAIMNNVIYVISTNSSPFELCHTFAHLPVECNL